MNTDYDILIAGGGMVGGTLACALGGSGLKVGVIEPQTVAAMDKGPDLRVSAITLGRRLAEDVAAVSALCRRAGAPWHAMGVMDSPVRPHRTHPMGHRDGDDLRSCECSGA